MAAGIAHLLDPRHKAVVQLSEAGDAVGFGLQQEALANIAICSFNFASALRPVRSAVDQTGAQDCAGAFEGRGNVRAALIHIDNFGLAAALDGGAQHLLTSARVLLGHPGAVDEQS